MYNARLCIFFSGITLPKDCSELVMHGNRHSGSFIIFPYGLLHLPTPVYCYFDGNDVWTVTIEWFFLH